MGEEGITTPGQAGTEYWPLGDQVNTPHETVNNASTTVDHVITNTFGVVTGESNPSIHHWAGFEGGHFDPDSVLTNDDHRWYDPVVGRWISEDPIGFGGGDANVARYVGNDPARHLDPVGEQESGQWLGTESHYAGDVAGHPTYTPINIFGLTLHKTATLKNYGVFHAHWYPGQYWGRLQHWNQHRPGPHPLQSFVNGPHPVYDWLHDRPVFGGDGDPLFGPIGPYIAGGFQAGPGYDPNDEHPLTGGGWLGW